VSTTIPLGVSELSLAAVLVLLNAAIALRLSLRITRPILLSALRSVVQLLLLGLVLDWVFAGERPVVVLTLMVLMALAAGYEAVRRASHRVPGLLTLSVLVMLASSLAVTFYATHIVIQVDPWYSPRYLIPILGMILGNSLNGISLGLDSALSGFRRERESVEMLLAHGATRREASRDVVRNAVRTGMIPILNAMVAAGLISIPGMMTGQILSGQDPQDAALYQILILFCISGGVALGTLGSVLGSVRLVFDERDRLRAERIQPRE
jgi:putative ABC transport system permease protein